MATKQSTLFSGRFLRLVQNDGWEYVERPNASAVVGLVATTPEGRLLLVEQHRVPLGQSVIELPAGLVGDTDSAEDLRTAAGRELLEETGYQAGRLELLAAGPSSAGLTTEVVTLVRATDLTKVSAGGGVDGERITVHEIALAEAAAWLQSQAGLGKAIDLKVYAALYFLMTAGR